MREELAGALERALTSLSPRRLVAEALPPLPPKGAHVRVVAAGKAAAAMTEGALDRWGDRVEAALAVTVDPLPSGLEARVDLRAASHPLPDERSVRAARAALALASDLGPRDLLLCLVSGGASSLLAAPPPGLSLDEKIAVVRALLAKGTPIAEVNLVRRHLSAVKGGRLARAAAPARVLTLLVSDVIGGAPHDVGSGPSVADPTTLAEARRVLQRAGLEEPRGLDESVKPVEGLRLRARVLADPSTLAEAVARELAALGLAARVEPADQGDVRQIAELRLVAASRLAPGEALVWATEPTVSLPPDPGRGGRAGRVALLALRGLPARVTLLCAASDGVDGTSGGAGAIVDASDAERADTSRLDEALARFDDGPFHAALGTQLPGGPTGHNLTDVHVLVRAR